MYFYCYVYFIKLCLTYAFVYNKLWKCPYIYILICYIIFFFQGSKMSLTELTLLLYFFSLDFNVADIEKLFPDIAQSSIIRWFQTFREKLISASHVPTMNTGVETKIDIVEIDESLFGKKQKYNRGRKTKKQWVFGIAQRDSRKTVFKVVQDRKNATLLPIIEQYVDTDSTIFHDDWAGYRKLEEMGYNHGTVCHKETFKSKDGVCTNLIEGLWGNLKMRICTQHGIRSELLQGFLDEFSIRYYFGQKNVIFHHMMSVCQATI